jgi:hypothetical protein
MPLPPYCKETREPHIDRTFCVYCGVADESQPASFQAPPIIQPTARNATASTAPVIDLSESPMAIRTNPTFSNQRVAQTAKDISGHKRSSRESLKSSSHAGAPAMSSRTSTTRQEPSIYRFAVRPILQDLYEKDGDIISGPRRTQCK